MRLSTHATHEAMQPGKQCFHKLPNVNNGRFYQGHGCKRSEIRMDGNMTEKIETAADAVKKLREVCNRSYSVQEVIDIFYSHEITELNLIKSIVSLLCKEDEEL